MSLRGNLQLDSTSTRNGELNIRLFFGRVGCHHICHKAKVKCASHFKLDFAFSLRKSAPVISGKQNSQCLLCPFSISPDSLYVYMYFYLLFTCFLSQPLPLYCKQPSYFCPDRAHFHSRQRSQLSWKIKQPIVSLGLSHNRGCKQDAPVLAGDRM